MTYLKLMRYGIIASILFGLSLGFAQEVMEEIRERTLVQNNEEKAPPNDEKTPELNAPAQQPKTSPAEANPAEVVTPKPAQSAPAEGQPAPESKPEGEAPLLPPTGETPPAPSGGEPLAPAGEEQALPPVATPIEEEAPKVEEAAVSPEVKLMQEIEPGFVPKDDRVIELFMLQRLVSENDVVIKQKNEQTVATRELFSRKFREDLAGFVSSRMNSFDKKIDASVDEAIKYYEIALKNNPNNPKFTPDALYSLGLYYFERDEKDYFEKLAHYNEAREQGREDVPYPEENFSRTIDTYERLIKDYPSFSKIDSVYYLLALALWYEGAFYNAVDHWQTLIKEFPNSRYVEEVWFRLGEYFYDMNEFDDAVKAYEKVAANPKSSLYDKALYKMAWSYYQKDDFSNAIRGFIRVLDLTYLEKGDSAQASMRAEVTRYIVKSFGEQLIMDEGRKDVKPQKGKEKEEHEYAERLGVKLTNRITEYFKALEKPPYMRDIYLETASQLMDESKTDGAVLAFERTIELDPKHQDNPRLASQIVDILQEAERLEDARKKNHELIRKYGKNSPWFKSQENNYEAQSFAREAVRDAMLALAVYYHKTGKDLKEAKNDKEANANFRRAAALYSSYVREYTEREDVYKAIFYFAEAAYELGRFRMALDSYQLLKDYPLPLPENTRRDATFNIVFTFRHVVEAEAKAGRFREVDFDALTSKQRGTERMEIPEIGRKYLASIDDFLKLAPQDEMVPVLLFHAAAIYYVYGQSDEALSRFYFIIDTYPGSTAAAVAARLIIDDAVSKEEWARVAELAKRYRDLNLGGAEADFARIEGNANFKIARAIFEEANALQAEKQLAPAKEKYKESAKLFAELLEKDPKNPYADIMLFNAARAIVMSGSSIDALPLYRKLYTQYPESEYSKTARFQEALTLEKMLKFADAAKAYDGIIKQDPKSEAAGDAMLNKALLYEAAGDLNNASLAFTDFAKKYPEREEAPDAYLSTAAIYKKTGKINKQLEMLQQFIKQYRKDPAKIPAVIEAHVQIADTYSDLQKTAKDPATRRLYEKLRLQNYNDALALYSPELQSPIAAFYAAKAQLILQKPEQDSFKQMTINARMGKEQGEQLTAMMKRLAELSAKNEAIIKSYAQPVWNAEALRRIGMLYEHLAKSMIKAPCPRDVASVDEFACDEYTVLLEDKAAVLEEKALSAYKQSYDIAMSAYDAPPELVDDILAGLNRLRPGEYQRVGNLIERREIGAVYGQGRMLSSGRMASSLHPKETDPDKTPKAPPVIEEKAPVEEAAPEAAPQEQPAEEEPTDELEEDFE